MLGTGAARWLGCVAAMLAAACGLADGRPADGRGGEPVVVASPDGRNAITLTLTDRGVEMAVARKGETQVTAVFARQGYVGVADAPDGRTCRLAGVDRRRVEGTVPAPVYKKASVDLAANEATVRFAEDWGFVLHARNDGVAYRLFTQKMGERMICVDSSSLVYPSAETRCWAGRNNGSWHGDRHQNSWETVFTNTAVAQLPPIDKALYYLPFVSEHAGVYTAFTESDLHDYPGTCLVRQRNAAAELSLWHAQVPAGEQVENPHVWVTKRGPGFACGPVDRRYPWRVFVLGDSPADLAAADIVWALATPADPKSDFSWVKPGIASWEWWSSCGLRNVPFTPGVNTETYLYFLDFAAEYGLPYLLIDAGWAVKGDISQINPNVDLKRIMAHAAAKKVDVILWVGWSQMRDNPDMQCAYLASLGAKGVKIDFMDRDDQEAVSSLERISAAAARHRLVLDWHGMFKPTGLERTYPNILNYEGIFGLEVHRWDPFDDMPRHDCQAAFTRMVAGPMDYTPGGMRNLSRAAYKPTRARGEVPTQGTRVHQMALQALYFAPLQMMADSASAYRENEVCARFMAGIPTVWDDTVALPSEMGRTAALARRKGEAWYVAAIGDWDPRTLALPTDFLKSGDWAVEAFVDADDADAAPTHWERRRSTLKAGEPLRAKLAPGGGFVARLVPAASAPAAQASAAATDYERLSCRDDAGTTRFLKVGLWAWPMPFDYDGDGVLDLVVGCPCGPYNGTYFFRNEGKAGDAAPVFAPGRKIGPGKFNATFEQVGGKPVVLQPQGANWDAHGDPLAGAVPFKGEPLPKRPYRIRHDTRHLADFDGDGRLDLVVAQDDYSLYGWDNAYDAFGNWTNGWLRGRMYVARNLKGEGAAAEYGPAEPLLLCDGTAAEVYGNPMPMLRDWDGDGDLDLLCGSFMDDFTYFENVGTRTKPVYVHGRKLRDPSGGELKLDLEMIVPAPVDWDGDGKLDLVVGDEDGRVALLRNTGRLDGGAPLFEAPRYFRQRAEDVNFGALSTPWVVDWDGDGDEDLVTGNSAGYIAFIENLSGKGVARPRWAEPRLLSCRGGDTRVPMTHDGAIQAQPIRFLAGYNGSIQGPCEEKWGYTAVCVADWDVDGRPDVMCNSIFGDIVWFRNPGPAEAGKPVLELEAPRPVEVDWEGPQPAQAWGWRKPQGRALLTQWRTTPVVTDWNGDGLADLVVLDTEGYLALFERTRGPRGELRVKAPRRAFADAAGRPLRLNDRKAGGSGRRKLCFCDWDGDGRPDLVVNGANADVMLNLGEADGVTRFAKPVPTAPRKLSNHTTSPCPCDFDGNGRKGLLVGAEDGYFYLLER